MESSDTIKFQKTCVTTVYTGKQPLDLTIQFNIFPRCHTKNIAFMGTLR